MRDRRPHHQHAAHASIKVSRQLSAESEAPGEREKTELDCIAAKELHVRNSVQ